MVVFRLGKIWDSRPSGPGVVLVFPFVDEHEIIDLRDPIACLSEVCDAHYSTRQLAQATLRNTIGTRTLAQIMADQDGIASQVEHILDRATAVWGIRIEKVVIKDIRFPRQLCRAMAAEAEAVRAAKAKMIFALGELSVCMLFV
ncbi:SPFH/Band 7/PHB domain protein [Teladorsagia circumcincta]|uniref:SPFH/Band 7/PHB domain protein n=1 Tax=Teladorsagia circumcincta TaxID=45464 RepID=A0A2G9UEF6_TELCI|nr:SPFH/Band 7/PHB domain protein [Teladorsagia circumcincta]